MVCGSRHRSGTAAAALSVVLYWAVLGARAVFCRAWLASSPRVRGSGAIWIAPSRRHPAVREGAAYPQHRVASMSTAASPLQGAAGAHVRVVDTQETATALVSK